MTRNRRPSPSEPSPGPALTAAEIERDLPVRCVGRSCLCYDAVASTNDVVKSVWADPRYDGLAVFAEFQTRGRGRSGRVWRSPPHSSVLCSVLRSLPGRIEAVSGLVNLASAVAAAGAVNRCFDVGVRLKWPNDLCHDHAKLGGILIEGSQLAADRAAFVIGIGINVTTSTDELPAGAMGPACSIATILGRPAGRADRLALARELLIELDRRLAEAEAGQAEALRSCWLALAAGRDGQLAVVHEGRRFPARMIDIDPRDNSLLVQDAGGLIWHLQATTSRIML